MTSSRPRRASTTRTRGSARPSAARRTTADRIRHAMDARKKMRWRRELAAALGDADDGVLSVLEYRYVRRVERPHGLPAARRQARIRQRTGNRYLDNLYEEYGVCVELDGTAAHPADEQWRDKRRDNGQHGPGHPHAQVRFSSSWANAAARPRTLSLPCCARAAGRAPPHPLLSPQAAHGGHHDRGQFAAIYAPKTGHDHELGPWDAPGSGAYVVGGTGEERLKLARGGWG